MLCSIKVLSHSHSHLYFILHPKLDVFSMRNNENLFMVILISHFSDVLPIGREHSVNAPPLKAADLTIQAEVSTANDGTHISCNN